MLRETPNRRLHGRYLSKEVIATGQVTALYYATDASGAGEYAIKEFSPIRLIRAEEQREAEAALNRAVERWARVEHPALPHLIETFKEGDKHYVVFEFVKGWNAAQIIADRRFPVGPDLVRNWGAQLCSLFACLHAQNPPLQGPFLSPSHVLVTPKGEVKLVGLGLGRIFQPDPENPLGTLRGYAAPELRRGLPTIQSDVFALGRLLYALLIRHPLEKGLRRQLPLQRAVPGISGQLVKAIAGAAHRDPDRRYSSMGAFGAALWDENIAPLKPVEGWLQRDGGEGRADGPMSATPETEAATSRGAPSMAEMGFSADPRFGVRTLARQEASVQREQARLSVYPRQFNLKDLRGEEERRLVLRLRNSGETEVVSRVTSHVAWVKAPKKAIRLPAHKQARVVLTVSAKMLSAGHTIEPQALSVEMPGGRQWIGATADIAVGPSLRIDQPLIDFGAFQGDVERSLPLTVSNAGRGTLKGRVTSRVPWLKVPREEFRCAPGSDTAITVQTVLGRLPRGAQRVQDALVVDSDGGQSTVEVRAWRTTAELDLGASHMDFGTVSNGETAERYLYVGNTGDGTLDGAARSLLPWLQVFPQRIYCEPGDLFQLTAVADCAGLGDGSLEVPQALRIQTNGGTRTLSLRMEVHAPILVVKTAHLDFGAVPLGEQREMPLIVGNEGSAPLEATIQPLVGWLTASDSQLTCGPHSEATVGVTANTAGFTRGERLEPATALRIVSGAVIASVPASITVLHAALHVEPPELDFGYIDRSQPEPLSLIISNEGTGDLAWNAQSDAVWLEMSARSGVCQEGESFPLTVTAYGLAMEEGADAARGTLIIGSDGGRAKIPVRLALASPMVATDTTFLDLGTSVNRHNVSGSFRIFNHGLGLLRGSVRASETWLGIDRASFECPMGRSVEVCVATDMEEFPKAASYGGGAIRIESNGGMAEVEVALNVTLAPELQPSEVVRLLRREPGEAPQGRLSIANAGMAVGQAEIGVGTPELVVSRTLCAIKPGKSVRIQVRWEGALPSSPEQLYIDVHAEGKHLRVPVELDDGVGGVTPA